MGIVLRYFCMITHSYIVKWCFSDGSLMTSIIARFGANSCGAMLVQTSSMLVEFVQIGRFDCEVARIREQYVGRASQQGIR
jgi:hypothetical protein